MRVVPLYLGLMVTPLIVGEHLLFRDGSHCTIRVELERRHDPLYHQGGTRENVGLTVPLRRNCEVGKNWGRSGSHCETRDEFACREEVWQGLVPLGMN